MPKGGARAGAGRKKNSKNKATIEREEQLAREIAARRSGNAPKSLAREVIERQMELAGQMVARYQRVTEEQAAALRLAGNPTAVASEGDPKLYGEWFDRWAKRADELAAYQSPKVKAVDAPAPPPDPDKMSRENTRRFGLRVFEGGKALDNGPPANAA